MRILLLHNQGGASAELVRCLSEHHFELVSTPDEPQFLTHLTQATPPTGPGFEAAIVDLEGAQNHRLDLVAQLRTEGNSTPILGYNSQGSEQELVTALDKGFDDYIGPNISGPVVVARVRALIRRAGVLKSTTTLNVGDISIDLLKREVRRAGKLIELQPREFAMLEFMLRNPRQPLTKLMIMQRVWNYNFDPQTNIVDVLICRLRSKIEDGFTSPVIQTVRGVGYLFAPNVGV